MSSHANLGKVVASLRRAKNMTQDELSKKAGISYSTLAKLERGAISSPSIYTIADIAKVLGVTVDEIVNPNKYKMTRGNGNEEIKFVYCDVNGVLVRFFQKAFTELSRDSGLNIDRIETLFWHYNDAANRGEISSPQFSAIMEKKLGLEPGVFNWEHRYMTNVEPILEMHKCLKEISKTTKVGLLSDNFPGFLNKMIANGLLPDINYSAIVESGTVKARKPEEKIYEIAEKMAQTPGKNIFFIDDSRTNLMSAERRGWRVSWFNDYQPKDSVARVKSALSAS